MPVPIDGERAGRYSSSARSNPVSQHDFSIEEIDFNKEEPFIVRYEVENPYGFT